MVLLALLVLPALLILPACSTQAQPPVSDNPPAAHFFVAPDGSDAWSGKLPAANKEKTDGPFATLERARQAVTTLPALPASGARTVLLRGGFYPLAFTIRFTAADSGTEQSPILYAAYPGETPVLSGGKPLTDWKKVAPEIWETTVPDTGAGRWRFQQLYVQGKRRYRPTLPKNGYYLIAAELPPTEANREKGYDRFRYRPGDLYTSWRNQEEIEVLAFQTWTMARFRLASLIAETATVTFTGPTRGLQSWNQLKTGGRYRVENVQEALSDPGEWYLESATGKLTYIAAGGEDPGKPAKTPIIAPRLERLLEIKDARHISFRGLTFAHTAWYTPAVGSNPGQAEVPVPSAITLTGARNIRFERCQVRNIGNWAFHLGRGTQNCHVESCEMVDLGAGGIKLGEMANEPDPEKLASHNTIRDCLIAQGGRVHPAAVGIWLGHTPYNTIEHNEITDFYYTGISVGWSWGYGPGSCHHNTIAYNHLYRLGQGVLSDMGGIYTLGVSPGTVLHHNRIYDVEANEYGGWGIYFDEGSTGILAENNVVYNTSSAPFHQHYGRENTVRNNILAFGREAQLMRTRPEDHLSFTLEQNLIYYREGTLLGSNWSGENFRLRGNLYWNAGGEPVTFLGMTLTEWQAKGQDKGSLVADPLFLAPQKGDFTLSPNSPALPLGFTPIDISKAGRLSGPPYTGTAPRAFPAPPPPPPLEDGFEGAPVGSKPSHGVVIEEADAPLATIRVSNATASRGRQSLRFTDAAGQKAAYNPHLVYTPRLNDGRITGRFAVRLEPGAEFFHEWRDSASPYRVGPSLRINARGELLAGDRKLADIPSGQWVSLEITCVLGEKASGKWDLTLRPGDGARPQRFKDLPCGSGKGFRQLRWWGFVSLADAPATFYLDDVALR